MPLATKAELMELTLPIDLERDLAEAGGQVDPRESHFDQCLQARDLAAPFVEGIRGVLRPVLSGANFAYLVTQTPAAEGASHDELRGTMKVRTLGMAAALGTQAVTDVEGDGGALLSQVTPQKGMEHTQTSRGSLDPLKPHQEQIPDPPGANSRSVHDTKMYASILACVANQAGVTSQYSPLAEALALMQERHPEEAQQLWLPKYRLDPFDSNPEEKASGVLRAPEPIIREEDGDFYVDFGDMSTIDLDSRIALALFEQAVHDVRAEITPKPGESIIVDNAHATHARAGFDPSKGLRYFYVAHIAERHATPLVPQRFAA